MAGKRPPPHYYDRELVVDSNVNGRHNKRYRWPPSPSTPALDETIFRILCPSNKTGSVIGKGGSIVKALRQETGAKIKIEESVGGSDERVVIVSAPSGEKSRHIEGKEEAANGCDANELETSEKMVTDERVGNAMSAAQDALLRVHARIVEEDDDHGNEDDNASGKITTRLLVPSHQVGCLLGKRGKIIEQMREDTGAQIRILPRDQLPSCALPTDEVVQIVGELSVVKKALRVVSSRLQENPPKDRPQARFQQSPAYTPGGSAVPSHEEHYIAQAPVPVPVLSEVGAFQPGRPIAPMDEELIFRVLCPTEKIGIIMGKGGSIIQTLREETGAKIKVADPVPGSDERVIIVSALECPEDDLSPAQEAVFHIQDRLKDIGPDHDVVITRLLVPSNHVGCLLGKGGTIITEMRKITRANIRVLARDQLPKCALEDDEVVQIVGDIRVARDALVRVTSRLRANLYREKPSIEPARYSQPLGLPSSDLQGHVPGSPTYGGRHESASPGGLSLYVPGFGLKGGNVSPIRSSSSPPHSWSLQSNCGRNRFLSSGPLDQSGFADLGKYGLVTNTTIEALIPEAAVASIVGRNGNHLVQIREYSGASVRLLDSYTGASERIVEISGTPEQTNAAKSLLEAFILSGQS